MTILNVWDGTQWVEIGAQGFQGDQGNQGTSGEDSAFYLTAKHSDNSASFSGLSVFNFNVEGFYLTQNEPNTDEVMINLRQIKGDQGTQGNQGFQGDQGDTGAKGDQGTQGNQGTTGEGFYLTAKHSDDSASFSGLNLLTFNVDGFYLTQNDPNTDEVIINLRQIKGDQGDQGFQGDQGADGGGGGSAAKNALINGTFTVPQRGTAFDSTTTPANNDDTYLLDRWLLLSDGDNIVDISQETSVTPVGGSGAIKLDVETANAKFGILQVIEGINSDRFVGQTCSLRFKARITGSSIGAIRAAVLEWTSTEDSVTSDVVSAWNGAGTNPTLVANWAFSNTPAALTAPTTSYQTYTIENISVGSSATNVAVFIWIDDVTTTIGDFLYISEVQLEEGDTASDFERTLFTPELSRCQRYYWRPVFGHAGGVGFTLGVGVTSSTTACEMFNQFPVRMRATPSIGASDATHFQALPVIPPTQATTVKPILVNPSDSMTAIRYTVASGLVTGEAIRVRTNNASSFIDFDAEL